MYERGTKLRSVTCVLDDNLLLIVCVFNTVLQKKVDDVDAQLIQAQEEFSLLSGYKVRLLNSILKTASHNNPADLAS